MLSVVTVVDAAHQVILHPFSPNPAVDSPVNKSVGDRLALARLT